MRRVNDFRDAARSAPACLDFRLAIALAFLCFAPSGPSAIAAEVAAAEGSTGGLDEIVVTAQHVKENAQTTPIAMSVYGGDALKRNAITDLAGLSAVAPDVNFANVQGEPIVTIRGISSRDTTENGDPAVTVNVDGFYQNRQYSLNAVLYDIDRIEVLRGPQGTLNGRNSVGGAINIVTAQPTNTFAAYASLEYGNYNNLATQGMVNVPISDTLQMRLAFLTTSHDGYRNNAPQPNGDDADNKSARAELAFEPFDNFRGLLTFQYTKEGGAGDVSENIPYAYTPGGSLIKALPSGINPMTFKVDTPPFLDLTEKTLRFNFTYDIGAIQLTVLGGYDQTAWHHWVDDSNPYSTPAVFAFIQNEYPDTLNGEFRIASKSEAPFQWQAGAFFYREHSHLVSSNASPQTDGTYNEFFGFVYSTRDTSDAGYVQASYKFTDALKLTAGVRYTSDYKEEMGFYGQLTPLVVYSNQAGDASSTKSTFHAALDYQLTPENLLYAKYDTGYKGGGFNFGGGSYRPETVTAYELGTKNRFLNGTLQLNVAAFYDKYRDEQVSTFAFLSDGNSVALTENAGKSTLYGLETDFLAKVPVLGTLNASVDYLHARYTYFLSVGDPSDPTAKGNVNLAGNTPPQAPTWSAQLGLDHDWDIPGGTLTGRIESKLQSSSNFSFYDFPDTRQPAYTMSNAFLSYSPTSAAGSGRWKITAFVKNLENAAVYSNALENQYAVSYTYQFYPPRTYGLRFEQTW
jgi:iron complex outermembrane receptor protein